MQRFSRGLVVPASVFFIATLAAQNPELQAKIAEVKQAMAANKQALATYTWQEQQTVSLKGEVKKQALYQVQMGPDGKPQKTPIGPQEPQQQPSGGRLKKRIVEKKVDELKEYAQQISSLVQAYTQPNPEGMQQAFQSGNATLGSGGPGELQLVFHNYVKPGDTMTLVFSSAQKAIQSVQVSSYLSEPKDKVTFSAQFSQLPDGTNHLASSTVNGESKNLTIQIANTNYQKLG